MLLELLEIFIVLVVLLYLIIVIFLFVDESNTVKDRKEELLERGFNRHVGNWRAATPVIALNLLLLLFVSYGFFNVEFFFFNVTSGQDEIVGHIATGVAAYAWGFAGLFLIDCILLFLCGFYSWMDALLTKGIIPFKQK